MVSPPWTTARSAAIEVPVEVRDEGADLDARGRAGAPRDRSAARRRRSSAGPGPGAPPPGSSRRRARSSASPTPEPPDGDDHDALVVVVAELARAGPSRLADERRTGRSRSRSRRRRSGARSTRGSAAVPARTSSGTMSSGSPTKIARSRRRGNRSMCSIISRVVVGRQERLALAAVGHRQPAHEVGHPGEGRPLELRVLVEVVVDVPRLVADDEVVFAILDDVVEDHEVGHEDLVHPADRLEGVQVVACRLGGDVGRLAREPGARRVDPLARAPRARS